MVTFGSQVNEQKRQPAYQQARVGAIETFSAKVIQKADALAAPGRETRCHGWRSPEAPLVYDFSGRQGPEEPVRRPPEPGC